MNDINRKKMNDVMVSHNDIIRREGNVPEPYTAPVKSGPGRIDANPFFEKGWKNTRAAQKQEETNPIKTRDRQSPKALLWAFVIIILLIGGFFAANYFSSATIEITPIVRNAHIDSNFTTFADGIGGDLVYKFTSLVKEESKDVPATIEKKVQQKASGKVIIFNAYSGSSQRLIKNTRLESPDHKIFRIDTSVVVPGATMVGGKVTVPGKVEALVYADVPGKEYNIGLSDFTIPGFKGDPRYDKFTAKSETSSPIIGGFSGTVKVPSDAAITTTQDELKQDLKKITVDAAQAQIPSGVSFFPGSVVIKFEEVPQDFTTTDTSKITMRATLSLFFFDTATLTNKLAQALPSPDNGKMFNIPNMSSLTFTFVDPVDNVVLSDLKKFNFHITGDPQFVGQIDAQKIKDLFAGKDKKDFSDMIANQNNIAQADAVIRPVWKTVFPSSSQKIDVKILTN